MSESRRVSELTLDELKEVLDEVIDRKLDEFFLDPDRNLKLRPEIEARLIESLQDSEKGESLYSAEEVAEKLGLDWK